MPAVAVWTTTLTRATGTAAEARAEPFFAAAVLLSRNTTDRVRPDAAARIGLSSTASARAPPDARARQEPPSPSDHDHAGRPQTPQRRRCWRRARGLEATWTVADAPPEPALAPCGPTRPYYQRRPD